jgi:subtilisin family serine protease
MLRSKSLTLLGAVFIAAASSGSVAQEATFRTQTTAEVVPGQFIVKYTSRTRQAEQRESLSQKNVDVVETFPLIGADLIQIGDRNEAFARGLATDLPDVEYIEPVYVVRATKVPNDPRYSEQWGYSKIKAPQAWDRKTDSGNVIVAVIDTGVDYLHPEIAANMWKNPGETPDNGIDDDGNGVVDDVFGANFSTDTTTGDPMDDNRHGTHVAGTIGAVSDNNLGVAGINWGTRIMALKFLAANGSGTTAGAIRAIEYGIGMKANIMNNSWGGGGFSRALEDAIKAANQAGILFAAAAGNSGADNDSSPFYPANYDVPNVLSVMATDQNDNKAGFSHFGRTTVDLGAPGVDILSTTPGGNYASFNGTSMATPHVAGAAALVLGDQPSLSVMDLKQRLMSTADIIPALSGLSVTGGRLNLVAALGSSNGDGDTGECDKHSAQIAYQEFFWSENRQVDRNSNVLSVKFKLPVAMVVDIEANASARRVSGSGNTVFRTGVYSQPAPNTMWTGSYRRGTFSTSNGSRMVSSTFSIVLPKGEHDVYWKFWVANATVQFDSGALMVRAFPCSMGGKLDISAAGSKTDATEADPAMRTRQESLKDDAEGNSVTTAQ